MMERQPNIGEVRGIGLMIGVELVEDRESKTPATELRDKIVDLAFERGLLIMGCGKSALRIAPPLCITRDEMAEGLRLIEESLEAAL